MSNSGKQCCSNPKLVLVTLGIFALFGFLALILSGYVGNESPEDRAYRVTTLSWVPGGGTW